MSSSAVALKEIVESAIESHQGKIGALLPVLHSIQDKLGHIPSESISMIAAAMTGRNSRRDEFLSRLSR